ncbi:hypothetical protein KR009_011164 [Drosophila setifemur]|nr:hypothetical protein KR009_011164 [Drosophila setifemur]
MPLKRLCNNFQEMKISEHDPLKLLTSELSSLNILNQQPLEEHTQVGNEWGVKKLPMKHKSLLRMPSVHCVEGKTPEGREWIQNSLSDNQNELSWVQFTDNKVVSGGDFDFGTFKEECGNLENPVFKRVAGYLGREDLETTPGNPYDFSNLITECENCNRLDQGDDVNVNDLAGYLDTMLNIPKNMSLMAQMMYN